MYSTFTTTSFAPGAPVSLSARPLFGAAVMALVKTTAPAHEIYPGMSSPVLPGIGIVSTGVVVPTVTFAAVAL